MSGHGVLSSFRQEIRTYVPADVILHGVRTVLDESLDVTGLQKALVVGRIVRVIHMQANVQDAHVQDRSTT